jgi:hypothetical protein
VIDLPQLTIVWLLSEKYSPEFCQVYSKIQANEGNVVEGRYEHDLYQQWHNSSAEDDAPSTDRHIEFQMVSTHRLFASQSLFLTFQDF